MKPGFGSMSKKKQRKIASMGGKAQGKHNNPGNFANDPTRASIAGRLGGKAQGRHSNPANFANNVRLAIRAGRKRHKRTKDY